MDNREHIAALARTARQGSQEAFNELYRLTRDRAYFVAFTITRNEQDAFDIVQDSYLKAWQSLGNLQAPERFTAWLQQITGNTAKDYIKRHQPLLFPGGGEDGTDDIFDLQAEKDSDYIPDASMDTEETRRLIMEIVDSLPEDQRLCTLMYYYDDIPVGDIAAALGISQNTVKTRLRLARGKISRDVEALEKKQGIKLYGAAPFLLFLWLLRRLSAESSSKLPPVVFGSSKAGAGAGAAASSALTTPTALAWPKIIAGIVAAMMIVTGSVAVIIAARRGKAQPVAVPATESTALAYERTTAADPSTLPAIETGVHTTHSKSSIPAQTSPGDTTSATTSAAATTTASTTATTINPTTTRQAYVPLSRESTTRRTYKFPTRAAPATTTTTTTTTTAPPGPVKITRESNGVIFEYMSDAFSPDAQFTAVVGGGTFTTQIINPVADTIVESFRLGCTLNGAVMHSVPGLTVRLPVPLADLPDIAVLEVEHCTSPMNPVTVTATIDGRYLVFTTNYI